MAPEQPVQIFLSYARNDDLPPPEDGSKKGFVGTLVDHLNYQLIDCGDVQATIWRDVARLDEADQFDARIAEAISASALLLVVLSPNWLRSEYCRRELAAFADRWRADGSNVRERIIVVGKRHVEPDRRPSLLQGQTGFHFFSLDDPDEPGFEREFFGRGERRDPRFYERAEKLGDVLRRRVQRLRRESDAPPAAAPVRPGKAVFLAKPAGDMREAYARLATELTAAGYRVLPDPVEDFPLDAAAGQFVDQALAQAAFSIHLLGEKPGFAPEGAGPIVTLQLARAAAKAVGGGEHGLERLIWGPKFMPESDAVRDPHAVLARFDQSLPGDKLVSGTLSEFAAFVLQRLVRASAPAMPDDEALAGGSVYVYHRPEDMEYAFSIGKALRAHDLNPKFPAYEGSDTERVLLHRQELRECDSVLVCWASAPDVWVKGFAHELIDWKLLGRTKGFTRRGLVAGPPPGFPKKMFVELYPKNEIDVVLDLTAQSHPPQPEDIQPIFVAR